jgi:hypothetical protein
MKTSYQQFIEKPEISFWFPIFITVTTWVFSFGVLYTKVETVIKLQEQQYSMWLQLEKRVGNNEISIAKNDQFHQEVKNILKLQ